MTTRCEASYDVRVWSISRYQGKRGTTYTVRWAVAGKRHQRTFPTHKPAEAFRADLLVAARDGVPFGVSDGLPRAMRAPQQTRTWLDHAMEYVSIKWPGASPRHRRGIAEALTDITMALLPEEKAPVSTGELRRTLYRYAFNVPARKDTALKELESALAWMQRRSPALADLNDAVVLRGLLNRLALRQDGKPAAPSTIARKRATLHSVLEYAVELELFPTNPLKRVRWKAPIPTDVVDCRVVVNPAQARALLDAVWEQGPALAAFFACLYYAGLRPAEARNLRLDDCTLPETGWGRLLLTSSHQTSGSAWTDEATSGEDRGLKHRGRADIRLVPAHPELVKALRRHIDTFQLGRDGRLFVTRTGKAGVPISPPYDNPVSMGTIYRAWHKAREAALDERQVDSMLARRPYDLRHACVSTWLNAGVPPAQVAEWAGHGVEVLLRVYAKCVDGADHVALRRIKDATR
jgi:integrase